MRPLVKYWHGERIGLPSFIHMHYIPLTSFPRMYSCQTEQMKLADQMKLAALFVPPKDSIQSERLLEYKNQKKIGHKAKHMRLQLVLRSIHGI